MTLTLRSKLAGKNCNLLIIQATETKPKSSGKCRQFKRFLISASYRSPQKNTPSNRGGYRTLTDDTLVFIWLPFFFSTATRRQIAGSTHHSHNSRQENASNIAGPKTSI